MEIMGERVEIGTQRIGGEVLFPQPIAMAFAMAFAMTIWGLWRFLAVFFR